MLSEADASSIVQAATQVVRADVARAKQFILTKCAPPPEQDLIDTEELAREWGRTEIADLSQTVNLESETEAREALTRHARAYSLRLSFYQAIWELVHSVHLLPSGTTALWRPALEGYTARTRGGISLRWLHCVYPEKVSLPPIRPSAPSDLDLLVDQALLKVLHPGVQEALRLAIDCLRRDLYLPAIAMLGSAAEAEWIERATVAMKREGTSAAAAVLTTLSDPFIGFGKKVGDICNHLNGPGVATRKAAGVTAAQLLEAQTWTTTVRDHRNALHWGKAQSFGKSYSEAATLLMAVPIHFGTLEALR